MTTEKWLDDNCRLVIDPHDGKPSPYLLKHGGGSFIALEPVKLIKPERESELKKLKRLEGARDAAFFAGDWDKDIELYIKVLRLKWKLHPGTRPNKG